METFTQEMVLFGFSSFLCFQENQNLISCLIGKVQTIRGIQQAIQRALYFQYFLLKLCHYAGNLGFMRMEQENV